MKIHIIKYAFYDIYNGYDGTFTTYCGITEECSKELYEGYLCSGDSIHLATCKKCIKNHLKHENMQTK